MKFNYKLFISVFLLCMLLLSSCGDDTTTPPAEDGTSDVTSNVTSETLETSETIPDNTSETVTVYFHYSEDNVKKITVNATYNMMAFQPKTPYHFKFLGWTYEELQNTDGDYTAITTEMLLNEHSGEEVSLYPIFRLNLDEQQSFYFGDGRLQGLSYTFLQQETATLPDGSSRIGNTAFRINGDPSYCKIKTLIIPNGYTTLDDNVFTGTSIEKVVIPASMQTVNELAFEGSNVTTIEYIPNEKFMVGIHFGGYEGGYTYVMMYPEKLLRPEALENVDTLDLSDSLPWVYTHEIAEDFWKKTVENYVKIYGSEPSHIKKIVLPKHIRVMNDLSLLQSDIELVTDNCPELSYVRKDQDSLTCIGLPIYDVIDEEIYPEQNTVTIPSSKGTTQTAVTELDQDFWKNTWKMYHYKFVIHDKFPEEHISLDWVKKIVVPKGITVPDGAFDGFEGEIVYEE